ncbi:cupin domain-containing protein [Cohnella sp. CFH 77786]|uniref:helix-turn-helix domain-containing protein n=1 Tax=Cohnella sp. CFH 77786 TaxID=2662265 RepID=UPI001C60F61F|nr:XRE family transcriptional regulator [Cohnella sp. CFH 77786]MBW5447195.1 cupin domain-containing protein [Cohnella sp. CFH 77786]
MEVGTNIRAIRHKRGITMEKLCEGTGLSQGFVSLLENNKTTPSLTTLETIADFFQVPMAYLLLKQDERMSVVRKADRTHSIYRGSNKIEHLAEIGGLRMSISEIPPGFNEERVTNQHEGLETHYVIKGRLAVGQGEDEFVVEEGDSFSWYASVPHWVRNVGEEQAVLLMVVYNEHYRK